MYLKISVESFGYITSASSSLVFYSFTVYAAWRVACLLWIHHFPLLKCHSQSSVIAVSLCCLTPPRLSLCVCSCVSMLAWPSGHATKSCDLDVPFYFSVKELKTVFVSMPKWKNSLLKSALKTGQAFQAVLIEISLK